MSDNNSGEPTRVLLLRSGGDEVAAISARTPSPAWRSLADSALAAVLPHLVTADGPAPTAASVRYFTMRPEDLKAWDALRRRGDGGYSYGSLWGDKGISKNVQFKETPPPAQSTGATPPLDPVALGTAIAVAQIQADVQRLIALVEDVAFDVKAILQFLHLGQEAEVLAATETIREIFARHSMDLHVGSIDWDRLAGLEQVLKTQHRQIVGELDSIADVMQFEDVQQAKAAAKVTAERVRNLMSLDWYVLESLSMWSQLMISAKASRGENSLGAANETRRLIENYVEDLRSALRRISKAKSEMHGRGFLEKLFSDGFILGTRKDDQVATEARSRRDELRNITTIYRQLPALVGQTSIAIELDETLSISPVVALTVE